MRQPAVIFDMDGVLVDTEPSYLQSNTALFRELGFTIPAEEYASFVGSSAQKMWGTLKARFNLEEEVGDLIARSYRAHLDRLVAMESLEPIPGIVALLDRLTDLALPLGLASSSPRPVIELTLKKSGLAGYFPVRVAGDEVARGKPHPDIFLATASLLGVPPARCLVVEDSPHGVAGAKAAGMGVVGFANPNSGAQDLSRADMIIHSFTAAELEGLERLLADRQA